MAETRGNKQYEIEAQKRQRIYNLELFVSVTRGPRGKKKLRGEALTKDTETPAIYFCVTEGDSEEEICQNFLRLLVHRGYLPVRVRTQDEPGKRYGEWKPVSLDGIDISRVLEAERGRA